MNMVFALCMVLSAGHPYMIDITFDVIRECISWK
jgi:hypothetical protein